MNIWNSFHWSVLFSDVIPYVTDPKRPCCCEGKDKCAMFYPKLPRVTREWRKSRWEMGVEKVTNGARVRAGSSRALKTRTTHWILGRMKRVFLFFVNVYFYSHTFLICFIFFFFKVPGFLDLYFWIFSFILCCIVDSFFPLCPLHPSLFGLIPL